MIVFSDITVLKRNYIDLFIANPNSRFASFGCKSIEYPIEKLIDYCNSIVLPEILKKINIDTEETFDEKKLRSEILNLDEENGVNQDFKNRVFKDKANVIEKLVISFKEVTDLERNKHKIIRFLDVLNKELKDYSNENIDQWLEEVNKWKNRFKEEAKRFLESKKSIYLEEKDRLILNFDNVIKKNLEKNFNFRLIIRIASRTRQLIDDEKNNMLIDKIKESLRIFKRFMY